MGKLGLRLGLKYHQHSFHVHQSDILKRMSLMGMELGMMLELEDSFRIHQCGILMGRLTLRCLQQCPMCMNHQFCVVQMGILMILEYQELEMELGYRQKVLMALMVMRILMVMMMVMIRNSSIRNSCHLRMQLQLGL